MKISIGVRGNDDVNFVSIGGMDLLAVDVVLVLSVLDHSLGLVTGDVVLSLGISEKSCLTIEGIAFNCRLLLFIEPLI